MIDWSKMHTPEQRATEAAQAARENWKTERTGNVARIQVTTAAGNTFDGDEISQGRMARAILGLQVAGEGATIRWVVADNSTIQVTAAELTEALMLAGQAQADMWIFTPF